MGPPQPRHEAGSWCLCAAFELNQSGNAAESASAPNPAIQTGSHCQYYNVAHLLWSTNRARSQHLLPLLDPRCMYPVCYYIDSSLSFLASAGQMCVACPGLIPEAQRLASSSG